MTAISKKILRTAYHEAGHVAAHLYFKHPIKLVTIIPDPTQSSLGHVMPVSKKNIDELVEFGIPSAQDERWFKQELIILMAGGESEGKFLGKRNVSSGRAGDIASLVRYCEAINIYGRSLFYYSKHIIEEAKNLVKREEIWRFIEALSNQLIIEKTIKGKECNALYKHHCGYLHSD